MSNDTIQSLRSRLMRGGAWALTMRVAGGLAYLGANALLARTLAPNDLGVYYLAASLVTAVGAVGEFGLGRAASRLIAERLSVGRPDQALRVTRLAVSTGWLTGLTAALVYATLGGWAATALFHKPGLALLTPIVAAWIFFMTAQRVQGETFRGYHDIRLATMFGYTTDGLAPSTILIAMLIAAGSLHVLGLRAVTSLSAGAIAFSAVLALVLLRRKTAALPRDQSAAAVAPIDRRVLLTIGGPIAVTALAGVIMNNQFDLALLGRFGTPPQIALYGAAVRLTMFVTMPLMIVNAVLPPFIAELHATQQHARLQRVLSASALVTGIPALLVLVVLAVAGAPILRFVFGGYYGAASPVLVLLAIAQAVNVLGGSCGLVLVMTGHQVQMMRISLVIGVMSVAVGLFAAWRFGPIGLAVAAILREVLGNGLRVLVVHRELGLWTQMPLSLRAFRPANETT